MLSSLALYILCIAGGIFVGKKILKPGRRYGWIGRIQTAALILLIFTMGVTIGADRRVLSSLGTLGLQALLISVLAVAGSVLACFAVRKLLGFRRSGVREEKGRRSPKSEMEQTGGDRN